MRDGAGTTALRSLAEDDGLVPARLRQLQLVGCIGSTSGSRLHRGRLADGTPVLVKRPEENADSRIASARLREERDLFQRLALVEIGPRPIAFLAHPVAPALVLEDRPGELLGDILAGGRLGMAEGLGIAADLAAALAELHAAGLVYRDLRPANVLVMPSEGRGRTRACLIDLSRTVLEGSPALVEASDDLAFLSPERTGRIGREVDARSDLYSLGVLLYRFLTGELPFTASDLLGWIHCHVARQPRPPVELCPVPRTASDIAMRLLAKLPDDRYQSAQGVAFDLEECLKRCGSGIDRPFCLGARDVSARFHLPGRLYGRQGELDVLVRAFHRTASSGAPGLVLVAGASGIGKSSLVHELRPRFAEAGARFGHGKFDRERRGSPYAALGKAADGLVQQILSASEEEAAGWRELLLGALGNQGQLLVDLIPQLALLIGPQPQVPNLPLKEAQLRFERVWQRFLAALASAEHPIVLFLDDMQWADPGTLGVVEYVAIHPDTHHVLFLGAYRDDEVDPSHPLVGVMEVLRKEGVAVETLVPGPFSREDSGRLVAETLHCDAARCAPLAALIHGKTGGNPFFFIQFLSMLHEEGLVEFDRSRGEWTWNIDRIQTRQHAGDVDALISAKLEQLSEPTRRVVRLAACLGNGFDLDTLALIHGRPRQETERELSEAVERGYLHVGAEGTVRFEHDRVQEAAYNLIPEEERPRRHLEIGRLLAARAGGGALGDDVFDVVDHFRRGEPFLHADERIRLAELELEAGRRAEASTAYHLAAQHFAGGQALLPADGWCSQYALSFALALERARCEWLAGDFDAAEAWISALLREARTSAERAEAYRVRIDLLTTRNDVGACVGTALEACARLFGREFPLHPSAADLEKAVAAVLDALGGRTIEEQLEAPDMVDRDLQALLALVSSSLPTAFLMDPLLQDLMVCELVRLSLQHGNSPHSSHAFVSFALVLGCRMGRWSEAFRFSEVACGLADRYRTGSKVATYYLAGVLEHQVRSPGEAVGRLRTAWQAAVDGGDANHGCYAGLQLLSYRLAAGEPLAGVAEEAKRQLDFARSLRYRPLYDNILVLAQLVESLRGGTPRLGSLDGPGFDSTALEARLATSGPYVPGAYHVSRAFAELVAGDFTAALAASARAAPHVREDPFTMTEDHWFCAAMAASGRHDQLGPEEQRPLVETALESRERLRAQSLRNPRTFGPRLALVDAEIARLEGRDVDALRGYDESVAAARQGGFMQVEGMAGEAAARFHRQRGSAIGAGAHLRAARDAYRRWGATAKVKALELEYPELRFEHAGPAAADGAGVQQLDLLAAARVSQAISGEINLERLLETILRTVVESAGAQSGWLLLNSGENLSLAARVTLSPAGFDFRIFTEIPGAAEDLPSSILSYTRRTREPVVLSDAAAPNPFSTDGGLRRRAARSVVSLPIVRQGSVTALLYLENDLVPCAFTPERLALLELLAAQAAISLELSRHREQLEGLVARRTEELTRANESLRGANQKLERAHRQLLHSEKMASIGQLAAGVAHEINNPVAYISSNLVALEDHVDELMQLARAGDPCGEALPAEALAKVRAARKGIDLEELRDELDSLIVDTKHGLERVKTIVRSLRTFSHASEATWQVADVRSGLDSTLHLLRNELDRKAQVVVEYGETPCVECLPQELNQVFMNVLLNAAQSITGRGTITVRTGSAGEEVWIEVSDTGQGIAPENLTRIFDPFFTTKAIGEGTGLGLAIAYGIVEKHHGRIEVASEVGQGTRFRICIPVEQHPAPSFRSPAA